MSYSGKTKKKGRPWEAYGPPAPPGFTTGWLRAARCFTRRLARDKARRYETEASPRFYPASPRAVRPQGTHWPSYVTKSSSAQVGLLSGSGGALGLAGRATVRGVCGVVVG
jgi:hypothetical protein